MEQVSIVIPVYNQWNLVKRNVDALLKFDREFIYEIIVVNDCSPENNPYEFDKTIVTIIDNKKNLGYTGTVNNGLRKAISEIIILLDSDAYPIHPFIGEVLERYKSDKQIGCIGFATVDDTGKKTGSFRHPPTLVGLIVGQRIEAKLDKFKFRNHTEILPYSCSVSFRKRCLEDLKYFDEYNFPVLDADHDLSIRIHKSKWKLIYSGDIIVSHKGGHSYQINYKRVLLHHKSRWNLLKKHNQLASPSFSKFLLSSRIKSEIVVFRLLSLIEVKQKGYNEKREGRKIILSEVKKFS